MEIKHPYFLSGILFFSISLVIFYIFAFAGWPGAPHFCIELDHCYCETIQYDALVRQPSNTWSNLSLVISGLYIIYTLENAKNSSSDKISDKSNPMLSLNAYSLTFSYITIFIGIGSFYFHGSMTMWGGLLDLIAMNMFITFIILYDLTRLTNISEKLCVIIFIGLNTLFAILSWLPDIGRHIFSALIIICFSLEALISLSDGKIIVKLGRSLGIEMKPITRDFKYLLLVALTFGVSTLIWNLSKDGGPCCDPATIWQGHSFWHLGVGLASFIIFKYLQTEKLTNK